MSHLSRPILSQVEPSCRSKLSAPLHPSPMHIPNPLSEYYSLLCSYAIFEQFKILLHYSLQRPTLGLSSVQTRAFLGANLPFAPSKLPLWTILSLALPNPLIINHLQFFNKTMNNVYKIPIKNPSILLNSQHIGSVLADNDTHHIRYDKHNNRN